MEAPWARVAVTFYRHPRTRRLSKDAQHLYLASILHCVEFSTDGRFPADETPYLASVSRVRSSLKEELLNAGAWVQQGDDEILIRDFLQHQTSRDEIEAKSKKARAAAEARWNQTQSEPDSEPHAGRNAPSNATGNADADADAKPVEKSRAEESLLPPPAPAEDGFETFWRQYPKRDGKKVGKANAHKVWKRMTRLERDLAMVGVEHYAASGWKAKDAVRWLEGRVWEDWQEPAKPDEPKRDEPPRGFR